MENRAPGAELLTAPERSRLHTPCEELTGHGIRIATPKGRSALNGGPNERRVVVQKMKAVVYRGINDLRGRGGAQAATAGWRGRHARRDGRPMLSRLRVGAALGGALTIALNIGCASAVPRITLQGTLSDLELLVGEWQGGYTSPATRRTGLIWFTLVAGEDHAHGDVMMTPRGQKSYSRYAPGQGATPNQRRSPTQFLSIRFVRASDGRLSGTLDPVLGPRL